MQKSRTRQAHKSNFSFFFNIFLHDINYQASKKYFFRRKRQRNRGKMLEICIKWKQTYSKDFKLNLINLNTKYIYMYIYFILCMHSFDVTFYK